MDPRALQRAQRDWRTLQEDPLEGVAAEPIDDTNMVWHANLSLGGAALHFEVYLPAKYPQEPPQVCFPTGLPHPNCFPGKAPDGRATHRVCLDMLEATQTGEVGSGWSSAYDLRALFAQLQAFVLADKLQYATANSLTLDEALRRAKQYQCPHCAHKPTSAWPLEQPKQRQRMLRVQPCPRPLRAAQADAQDAPAPPALRLAAPEPRPWRDVQRLATLAARERQAPQLLEKGFQLPKRKRTQKGPDLQQQQERAAVTLQQLARRALARAAANALRRCLVKGSLAVRSAADEHRACTSRLAAVTTELIEAQEELARLEPSALGTVQRAAQAVLDQLPRDLRNLRKKLAKAEAKPDRERVAELNAALQAHEASAALPGALGQFGQDWDPRCRTQAFAAALPPALDTERQAQADRKEQRRVARRRANGLDLQQQRLLAQAQQWPAWIAAAQQLLCPPPSDRRVLRLVVAAWRPAPRVAAPALLPVVPYPVFVAVLLPSLGPADLLALACASQDLRKVAEDGVVWRRELKLRFPHSQLEPAAAQDWKYVFQLEQVQAVQSLACWHTKQRFQDCVLGLPIDFTVNPKTKRTDYIQSSFDLLSHGAFAIDGVRRNVYREPFTHWLPMYLSEDHWLRGRKLLQVCVVQLLNGGSFGKFAPEMCLEVFAKAVNTLVVLVCDKGQAMSERAAKSLCLLQRWALRCLEEWPHLRPQLNARLRLFMKSAQHRTKQAEPNLGELLPLLLVADVPWTKFAPHLLQEWMDRQTLWLCTESPELAKLGDADRLSDEERCQLSWAAKPVGKRLFCFHAILLHLCRDRPLEAQARQLDRLYGQPPQHLVQKLQQHVKELLACDSWPVWFRLLGAPLPTKAQLADQLRLAVKNSAAKNYHKPGMDFRRVHASGTSRILQKGESFLAAGTLKAVDLEDRWSWSGMSTKFLDATLLVYDAEHALLGTLDYQNPQLQSLGEGARRSKVRPGALSHSGDVMNEAKQSGLHRIHVQLDALPSQVEFLYVALSSWAGATLGEIRQPSVRLVSTEGELCRYDVEKADSSKTCILMCVLHRRSDRSSSAAARWALEAIGEVGMGAADNYGPVLDSVQRFCFAKGWPHQGR